MKIYISDGIPLLWKYRPPPLSDYCLIAAARTSSSRLSASISAARR